MKAVLEAVDPMACEFRRCQTVLPSGEAGPETWLCAVTRAFAGAVNVEGSDGLRVRQGPNGLPAFACTPMTRLKLNLDVLDAAHLFHIAEMASAVFCEQILKDACKAAQVKGVLFQQISGGGQRRKS